MCNITYIGHNEYSKLMYLIQLLRFLGFKKHKVKNIWQIEEFDHWLMNPSHENKTEIMNILHNPQINNLGMHLHSIVNYVNRFPQLLNRA